MTLRQKLACVGLAVFGLQIASAAAVLNLLISFISTSLNSVFLNSINLNLYPVLVSIYSHINQMKYK